MNIGVLYFNDSAASLQEKIEEAVQAYERKMGHAPNCVQANKAQLDGQAINPNGLRVVGAKNVRPNYLWVGVEDEPLDSKP